MAKAMNQRYAKTLVKDYLREAGHKGVTALMKELQRFHRQELFTKRTFELWLKEPDRMLQDKHWELVLPFIQSEQFRKFVPYAYDTPAEQRLKQVADGYLALYSSDQPSEGLYVLPSALQEEGSKAIQVLDGSWENVPNTIEGDVPRTICKVIPIEGKRYAKFAYIALFRSRQISATGIVIYLNSSERDDADYCHNFILQLWRRRDPESDSKLPGGLYYLSHGKEQPEFVISKVINQYFYKESEPIGASGDVLHALEPDDLETARYRKTGSLERVKHFNWVNDATEKTAVILKKNRQPFAEELEIIDQLLEDVLPHGLT